MSRAVYYKIAIAFVAVTLATHASPASAQQASIDNGLVYLRSTQNADGSWGGTATSLNTVFQTTATTAKTLQLLGLTEPSLTNAIGFLAAQSPDTVDDLAHQGEVLAASGGDVASLVASIQAARQGDGGWGIDLEQAFPSEVVDTVAAVRTLKVANALDPTATAAALGFLLENQNSDGGWGIVKDQPSHVFYTALLLLALKDFQRAFDLSAPLAAGTQFLAAQQNPDGSFGGSVFETALAFQALLRYTLNPTGRSAALAHLTSTQLADGSWGEDPFSTALALRALKDAQTAAQAQIQAVTLAKVVDGTQQPTTTYQAFETTAIGVTTADPNVLLEILVEDSAGTVFSTRIARGEFFFDTLNLAPGSYDVIVRAIDPVTGIIIDQQTSSLTIEPTVAVTNVVLGVSPGFTHVGATETVTVSLSLTNRSNASANLTIEHTIQSPSGTILSSGSTPLSLSPEQATASVTLATFSHSFTESGEHSIQAKVFSGTVLLSEEPGGIAAAPAIRIDPSITLTPQTVIPDGDKRIKIDIRLQGVEQQP